MKKLSIAKTLRKLKSCESGAVAPLVGFCAIMLVGAVAVAVDVGRGQVAQSKLQAALDSAGLAAGAVVSQTVDETALKAEARKYLDANFAGYTVDATIDADADGFVLDMSEDEKTITLSARATLPTTFMRIFGHDTMEVAARTEITREMTGLEIALVLDVTGSMCIPDCTKRDVMKEGAKSLVAKMFTEGGDSDDLWIGIVPFSQSVNIGIDEDEDGNLDHTDWLSDYAARMTYDNCVGPSSHANWTHTHVTGEAVPDYCPSSGPNVSTRTKAHTLVNDWMTAPDPVAPKVKFRTAAWNGPMAPWYFNPHAWSGCVEERHATGRDVTDDPPAVEGWKTYFAPDTSDSGGNNWRGPSSSGSALQQESGSYRVSASRSANKGCPPSPIVPLTNDKAKLDAAIDALDVSGYTLLPVGAAWGWRLLSPEWSDGVWGDPTMTANNLPLPYDEPLMDKAVIFLTDGDNWMPPDSTYTAYGRLSDEYLGTNVQAEAETELDARFLEVCQAMKDGTRGIKVYTMSVGTDIGADTRALLKSCASLEAYYCHAPDPEDVVTCFKEFADALSKLRVSK
jgi:Flp pilus assembly protein TadG